MKKIIKPWGYEKLLENNKYYTLKELFMKPCIKSLFLIAIQQSESI